jgi:hypothetical protein
MLASAAVVLCAGAATPLAAQAFLRGDANSDGAVSISDSHAILSYLFRGNATPTCLRTGDVNADQHMDISDAIFLLNFLFLGGTPPCAPFPSPGEDAGSELTCKSYELQPKLEDAAARLRIADAIAGPDGRATLNLFASNSAGIAGYSASIVLVGGRFGSGGSATDLSDTLAGGFLGAKAFGGKIRVGFLSSLTGPIHIPSGADQPVTQIEVCLESELPAGDYEMTLELPELVDFESARAITPIVVPGILAVPVDLGDTGCASPPDPNGTPGCGPVDPPDPPDPGERLDFARGDVNLDGRVSIADSMAIRDFLFLGLDMPPCLDAADVNDTGGIDIADEIFVLNHLFLDGPTPPPPFLVSGPDPTDDVFGCQTEQITPPAAHREDIIALGEAEGAAGQLVAVPVFLTSAVDIEAFQLIIRFDPAFFRPESAIDDGFDFRGSVFDSKPLQAFTSVRSLRPDSDHSVVAFVPHLSRAGFEVGPGERTHVFSILGRIAPGIAVGAESEIAFTDGPEGEGFDGVMLRNELSSSGRTRLPQLVAGRVRVVEGVPIRRGDANHNGRVDIADASFILNFLFLGGSDLRCPDEGDANDDGSLNIADASAILSTLFLGGSQIAPPFPDPGVDGTPDGLPDCR